MQLSGDAVQSGTVSPRRTKIRAVLIALPAGTAIAIIAAAGVQRLGGLDPTWRLAPIIAAALVAAVVVIVRPNAGVVAAVTSIVWIGVVRRLAGGANAYVANDPLIAVPALLMIPAVVVHLRARRRASHLVWLLLLLVLIMLAATAYGLLRASPLAVVRSAVFEIMPVLLAIGLVWTGDRRLPQIVLTTLRWVVPSAAVYGIVQYFAPPSWDLAWLIARAAETTTFGYPYVGQFRLFGPTSSPLSFATLLSVGILLWTFSRRPVAIRVVLIALMAIPLLLTAVRTAVFALIVTIVITLLRSRGPRALLPIAFGVAFGTLTVTAVVALSPDLASRFLVSNLGNDESYLARSALLAQYLGSGVFSLGIGFGSAVNGAQTIDNGYLAAFIELGFLGGLLYAALPVVILVKAAIPQFDRDIVAPWSLVLFLILTEVSAPLIQGELGIVFWISVGLLLILVRARRLSAAITPAGE